MPSAPAVVLCQQCAALPPGPLHVTDLLSVPDPLSGVLQWLMRQGGAGLCELAGQAGLGEDEARPWVDDLLARGLLAADGGVYRLNLRGRTRRPSGGNGAALNI